MTYKTWLRLHGILAVVFVAAATWHVVDLGRHSSLAMSTLILFLAAAGIRLLLKNTPSKKTQLSRI